MSGFMAPGDIRRLIEPDWVKAYRDVRDSSGDARVGATHRTADLLTKEYGQLNPKAAKALIDATEALIAKEADMASRPVYSYTRNGRVYKSAVKLTTQRQLDALINASVGVPVRKAKDDPPVPVFDENGVLIGICDPDDVLQIQKPVNPAAKVKANIAAGGSPAADPTVAAAAQDIAKALDGATVARPSSVLLKSAGAGYANRYTALLKSLEDAHDLSHLAKLKSAVTFAATRLSVAHGIPAGEAIKLAKAIAVDTADASPRRKSTRDSFAALKKRV